MVRNIYLSSHLKGSVEADRSGASLSTVPEDDT